MATDPLLAVNDRFVAVHGHGRQHYKDAGSGEPLILIHTNGASAWQYTEVFPLLLTRFPMATAEELTEFCRARMAKFKLPEYWLFPKEEFPKTSIGKIRKNLIRGDIHKDWDPSKYKKMK